MRISKALVGHASVIFFFLGSTLSPLAYAGDSAPKAAELVARHLDAIGSADARSAAKTRVVQGSATYNVVVGGGGRIEGKTGLVSEGRKMRFLMRFPQADYRGENVAFNGDSVGVAFANSSQSRSPFASFLTSQDVIVRDGLLGGVLSTGWGLLSVADPNPKLTVEGVKKVDGRPAYQVHYEPHKHSEVQIMLYFDCETFRHVKTVYSTSIANNVGASIVETSKLLPERNTLEERFSEFKTVDGLTLPTHWNIQFTRELPNGSTTISEWDLKEDQITNNMGLDPRNFELK
ncbi:MAG: hypothetical protein LAO22_08950 [Acidobacteriia bacterium]|nr:hypothetical protein [Terriglobia bacterium]